MKGSRKFWLQVIYLSLSFATVALALVLRMDAGMLAAVGGNIALIGTQLWGVARELTKEHVQTPAGEKGDA